MFDNIGQKIMTLAKVFCWIGIIISVLCGLVIMFAARYGSGFIPGVFTAAIGSLASWISSLALYGFGQLIDNTDSIVYQLRKLNEHRE